MVKKYLLIILLFLAVTPCIAQPITKAQIVNNCPDHLNQILDIYFDGVLVADNLLFRTATPFLDIYATVQVNIGIAPQGSTSVLDTFYNTTVLLQPFDTMIAIANGTESSAGYNPYQPFRVDTLMGARVTALNVNNTDVAFAHGSTDVPSIDFRTGIETVLNDIPFGEIKPYNEMPFGTYTFRLTNPNGNKVFNTYSLQLSALGIGQAGLLVTCGFMDPSVNNNGAIFQPMLVPATGGPFIPLQVTDPEPYARVQLINNSGDIMADTVDVYIGADKLLDNFPFRTAGHFFDAGVSSLVNIGIAPKNSTSVSDVFYTQMAAYDSGKVYVSVLDGIKSTSGYTPSPAFTVHSFTGALEEGTNAANTDILFLHGTTDFPTIDLMNGANILADNISYGNFNNYFSLPASANYVFTIGNDAGTMEIQKYKAQLLASGMQGKAITLLLSGFQDPTKNSNRPGYGLYSSSALGGPLLPWLISTSVNDPELNNKFSVWPNPATDNLYIENAVEPERIIITDVTGRLALQYQNPGNKIDISSLNEGIYFIRIEADGITGNQQFVKQ